MAWNNPFQEVANSKPLFLTIYGTVIIGIIVSSFYVFSAIYSPNSTTIWQSSPPANSMCFLSAVCMCGYMFNAFFINVVLYGISLVYWIKFLCIFEISYCVWLCWFFVEVGTFFLSEVHTLAEILVGEFGVIYDVSRIVSDHANFLLVR